MGSIYKEYETEFKPLYDKSKKMKWKFSQMFGEESNDSETSDQSEDGGII